MAPHYDVVVVGSGYGGGAVASRLARAGQRVAVLERGRELLPGDFPRSLRQARPHLQAQTNRRHLGRRDGLFDFRFTDDVGVLVGCGLGGTSLINAGVALRPPASVLADPCWPTALRGGTDPELDRGFARATAMLGSRAYPETAVDLAKLDALEEMARHIPGATFERPPINVATEAGPNAAGVHQPACSGCGDCVTGCNDGAKNTVHATYLADAARFGTEIYTGLTVESVRPVDGGRWQLRLALTTREAPSRFVETDVVVLAAGVLGSTEILLRSRDLGLDVSPELGHRVSGNSDFLAFAYDCDTTINGFGFGTATDRPKPVGPTITGSIRVPSPGGGTTLIEEGAVPGALAPLMPLAFFLQSTFGEPPRPTEPRRFLADLVGNLRFFGRDGAMDRTQTLLVMGPQDDVGVITLEDGRPTIVWPGAARSRHIHDNDALVSEIVRSMGGRYLRSPSWRNPLSDRYLTVHPLGGCAMADDPTLGVVDDRGRVFRGTTGDVHPGLYVADGAIIPRALGANPSLMITALAERIATHLIADRRARSAAAPPGGTRTARRSARPNRPPNPSERPRATRTPGRRQPHEEIEPG
jgi:cholesterol oxidase